MTTEFATATLFWTLKNVNPAVQSGVNNQFLGSNAPLSAQKGRLQVPKVRTNIYPTLK